MPADGGPVDLRPGNRPEAPDKQNRAQRAQPDSGWLPQALRRRDRRKLLRWAGFLLLPLALLAGAYFYVTGGRYMTTDDAYVEANKVAISTDVSGLVQQVDVRENERVKAGQVLFRLDPAPFRYALDQAEAQLGKVRDQIEALKANYRSLEAQIVEAKQNLAFYRRQFQRQKRLYAAGTASEVAYDKARRNLQNGQQSLASLQQQAKAAVAKLDGNPQIALAKHPLYQAALAQREEAARKLRHTVVRAPYAGIVTNVPSLQPGMYLKASTPAFSLVADRSVWVEAQAKETALTYVRPGQPVTVTVDTYPGLTWHGTLASIGPASAAQFSLLPAENTSGNWVKVVQRIPLRVRLKHKPGGPPLRAGMSAEISVDTGHENGLPGFLAGLFGGGNSKAG